MAASCQLHPYHDERPNNSIPNIRVPPGKPATDAGYIEYFGYMAKTCKRMSEGEFGTGDLALQLFLCDHQNHPISDIWRRFKPVSDIRPFVTLIYLYLALEIQRRGIDIHVELALQLRPVHQNPPLPLDDISPSLAHGTPGWFHLPQIHGILGSFDSVPCIGSPRQALYFWPSETPPTQSVQDLIEKINASLSDNPDDGCALGIEGTGIYFGLYAHLQDLNGRRLYPFPEGTELEAKKTYRVPLGFAYTILISGHKPQYCAK